jgi:hypothetical protein
MSISMDHMLTNFVTIRSSLAAWLNDKIPLNLNTKRAKG